MKFKNLNSKKLKAQTIQQLELLKVQIQNMEWLFLTPKQWVGVNMVKNGFLIKVIYL